MLVKTKYALKSPIEGIPFSNKEFALEVEFEADDLQGAVRGIEEQIRHLVEQYHLQIGNEIAGAREELLKKAQIELSDEYTEKLDTAKDEIIKLRKLLEDNGIQYK